MTIVNSKVHVCNGCDHRSPGAEKDDDRPTGLIGLVDGSKKPQGYMGTVDVPDGQGGFMSVPWYAHRLACVKPAIQRVHEDMLPPSTNDEQDEDTDDL
jgi:hypothetical protein